MKTATHAVPVLLSLLLLPLSAEVQAQAETLADCQSIQDRLARYACYDSWDAASGAVRPTPRPRAQQAEPAAPSAAPAQAVTERAEPAVADFGRAPSSSARVIEGDDGESTLIDTVAELEQLGPNLWQVTLEGGQQWRQMQSKRYNLQVGDEVRIYSTRWGSAYRMTADRVGGYIQVERVDAGRAALTNAPAPRAQAEAAPAPEAEDKPSLLDRLLLRGGDDEEPVPEPAAATAAGSAASVESFGRPQTGARVVEGLDGAAELIDTVAELEQLGPNIWLIQLEGGQRWQQMLSKRYNLQEGDEVRIYPTRWGENFRLTAPRLSGYIQVERID